MREAGVHENISDKLVWLKCRSQVMMKPKVIKETYVLLFEYKSEHEQNDINNNNVFSYHW